MRKTAALLCNLNQNAGTVRKRFLGAGVSLLDEECHSTLVVAYLKKKKTSLESASVDERFPISSGSLNLVKVLVNDVKQHSLEREIKTQSVMQKQDDIGKTDSLQGVIKERDVQIWSCNHVKQLLSSSPATPCSLAASNTGGQWPKERDELINGRETERQSI